jgi:hypothetical protein
MSLQSDILNFTNELLIIFPDDVNFNILKYMINSSNASDIKSKFYEYFHIYLYPYVQKYKLDNDYAITPNNIDNLLFPELYEKYSSKYDTIRYYHNMWKSIDDSEQEDIVVWLNYFLTKARSN